MTDHLLPTAILTALLAAVYGYLSVFTSLLLFDAVYKSDTRGFRRQFAFAHRCLPLAFGAACLLTFLNGPLAIVYVYRDIRSDRRETA